MVQGQFSSSFNPRQEKRRLFSIFRQRHSDLIILQIANLESVRGLKIEGLIQYCGVAQSDDGRKWLVTAPVGSPIIEGGDPMTIVERFAFVARIVGQLHELSRFLHGDLSYGNIISTEEGPRIIDWGTLQHQDSQSEVSGLLQPVQGAARIYVLFPGYCWL
jgi:hypothetical protein